MTELEALSMTLNENELEVEGFAMEKLVLSRRPSKSEWKEGGGVSKVIIRVMPKIPDDKKVVVKA